MLATVDSLAELPVSRRVRTRIALGQGRLYGLRVQQTLTVLQLALLARRVREHPDQLSHVLREPIAIVGMGCRFPGGVQTPQDFWQLLRQGRDAVSTRAADRSRLGVDQVTSSSPVTIAARVIDRPRALDPKRQVRSDRLPSRPPFASTRL